MSTLSADTNRGVMQRLFEPFAKALSPAAARRIAEFRVDPETAAHIAALAEKCNEDCFTSDDRAEYEAYVRAIELISALQSKARRVLSKHRRK